MLTGICEYITYAEERQYKWAGGPAWLRYRLDMAGIVGSNPTRPTTDLVLFMDSVYMWGAVDCIIPCSKLGEFYIGSETS